MKAPPGFTPYTGRTFVGWIHDGFQPPDELLDRPEEMSRLPGAEHLLDCRGRQIYRLPLIFEGVPRSCFAYYFTNASLGRSLRRSYAFRTLRTSLRLKKHGFSTLDVFAALKRRGELLNWTGLLIAGDLQSVHELPSAGRHVFQIHATISLSAELAASLGRFLATLHDTGFFHGDLKTRHILLTQGPDGCTFHLVDLEKCLYLPRLVSPLKVLAASRDLVQLFASLPEAEMECAGEVLLSSYMDAVRFSPRQKERLRQITGLYGKRGRFRQGRTLLANVLDLVKR
ncbi:MAG: lipopolysaccharide kinase InaA family protein [Acidobacteriota bacterium]